MTERKEQQIKSERRVADFGEVLTARREVEAMLDLVKNEAERIDSRFLEPACGTGNFLVAILERKLKTLQARYRTKQADFEAQLLSALGSIYGIDLLEDNVKESRQRLFELAVQAYQDSLRKKPDETFQNLIRFVLSKNIQQGDSLNGLDKIIFTQWSLIGYTVNREEYSLSQMNQEGDISNLPLFSVCENEQKEPIFIPKPLRSFPPVHYRKLLEETK
ncbi:SAM-dependent DNA methyltransferase [Candidatus Avelusimicrobium stercoris]|uniref:SAM-dependent DNA methyltransferase n=1 Tax=Candidatus Avelusimicrobium stercoris TaxID=1947924 RepID=UPI003D14F616